MSKAMSQVMSKAMSKAMSLRSLREHEKATQRRVSIERVPSILYIYIVCYYHLSKYDIYM